MKITKLVLIAGLTIFFGCEDPQKKTRIKVETDKVAPEGGLVILYKLGESQLIPLDTLALNDTNEYESEISIIEEALYRIDVLRQQSTNLILDGSESDVIIKFDGSSINIEGSVKSDQLRKIDELIAKYQGDIQQLNLEASQANQQGDQATVEAIIAQYESIQQKSESHLKELIRETSPSLTSVYGLNFLDLDANFDFFDTVATTTSEVLPNNFMVNKMKERVDMARFLFVGKVAPDFTLADTEGVDFSLSDLRGKYVLLDFWAAWCKPCRAENPNVLRMYNIYGGEQFEILGVSLDRTKEAWVKAIVDDGLPWKHVSDLKYFNSEAATLYNINAIPATFLIDPEGKILAKNLRGPTLEAKLQELFDGKVR